MEGIGCTRIQSSRSFENSVGKCTAGCEKGESPAKIAIFVGSGWNECAPPHNQATSENRQCVVVQSVVWRFWLLKGILLSNSTRHTHSVMLIPS